MEQTTDKIIAFLEAIGIEVEQDELDVDTFLPGIDVVAGTLSVDRRRLQFPGDLLHEAGHLAVAPASLRHTLSGEVVVPGIQPDILEMATMLWSYAAALHLGIDPSVVFHDGGYFGNSEALMFNFRLGIYPALHVLEEFRMAYGASKATELGVDPFPKMVKWTRE